jgi:dihydroorotate dehydrogenase electron transfer subunit
VGTGLLRRPFSVYRAKGDAVALLYRVVGRGTRWLAGVAPGDVLDALGPLGRPFAPPARGARLLLVGGGVGMAPLARYVEVHGGAGLRGVAGFRSAGQVAGLAPFLAAGVPLAITTEDGSRLAGPTPPEVVWRGGRPTDHLAAAIAGADRVLTCGPDPLMRAVAALAREAGVPCEASVERPMGCGIGVCLGCVLPVRGAGGEVTYARACREGPVLDAATVAW